MTAFQAWHLSGVDVEATRSREIGGLTLEYPDPTPALVDDVAARLRKAGAALVGRPVAEIVSAVDKAAARFLDPGDPSRAEALERLAAATGYAPKMASLVLDHMAADWRSGPLEDLLEAELGDPSVLDGFVARGSRRVRAYGPALSFHVFAGNVPGVAVTSLVRSLLVKGPVLGKVASGEPVLPVLFARALASADPLLGEAVAVTYWPGGSEAAERRALEAADVTVAYGGADAVGSLRARMGSGRLVTHGPRFSVGLVGSAAAGRDLAPQVARAVAVFDQHGCVSPHAVWVEEEAEPRELARAVAMALETLEGALPRGRISPGEASAIQQARGSAEIRRGAGVEVFSSSDTVWTVVYDPDPSFRPSCLNRFLRIHPVPSLEAAPGILAPVGHLLQSVAVEGARNPDALAHALARVGATRITTFSRLPWPPPEWHHDGRAPLGELLRWVDVEG